MQKCDGVDWDYYDKFNKLVDKYLPSQGEGENMATQLVTAITKIIYGLLFLSFILYSLSLLFGLSHQSSGLIIVPSLHIQLPSVNLSTSPLGHILLQVLRLPDELDIK